MKLFNSMKRATRLWLGHGKHWFKIRCLQMLSKMLESLREIMSTKYVYIQYADDTMVMVHDLHSLLQLLKLLIKQFFKNISGLEINKHKTEAMWLGSWRNCIEKPFCFKWHQNSIKTLGVALLIIMTQYPVLNHHYFLQFSLLYRASMDSSFFSYLYKN